MNLSMTPEYTKRFIHSTPNGLFHQMVYDGLIAPMGDNLLVHEQVTELRRLALSRLIEVHGQAEVARRMKRLPQQIHDMARSKSFGEKVALEMERAWSESTGGEVIDLIAPRPRDDRAPAPAGWDRLDDLGRMRVEAYISGLLAQPATSTSPEPGRFQAD